MKKLLFPIISALLLSPLLTSALIIDKSAPLGTPNNPINVIQVQTQDQILDQHRRNLQDLQRQQRELERDLMQGVMDRQNQFMQQNRVRPITPNFIGIPAATQPTTQTTRSTEPEECGKLATLGTCLCKKLGHSEMECASAMGWDSEETYRNACGPRSKWTGKLTFYENSIGIRCTCEAGFTLIDKPGYPPNLQCPKFEETAAQKPGILRWFLGLFGIV